MTRYEYLINKANRCRITARKVTGFMRNVWMEKAQQLEFEAANLPLVLADNRSC